MSEFKEEPNLLLYEPGEKDYDALQHVYSRLYKMQHIRDRNYNYFNDRNLISFIDDSTKRWNGYVPPRDDLTEDWQARVFVNLTRDTVINFLSQVAVNQPKAVIKVRNRKGYDDSKRAYILTKFLEYSRQKEDGERKFFNCALEMTVKGTVIAYEGFRKTKRKVEEIDYTDVITGKVESKEKSIIDYNDCWRSIVPLEDFYVGNIWQSDMQMQPDVIWKSIIRKVEAKIEFGKYPNWKYVKAGAYTSLVEQLPFFKNVQYAELESDHVEIIRYYNRFKDKMIIVANGVILYNGCIPFTHKKYPFTVGRFEPFAVDFFYGNSLPNKIATDNDILNTLWSMMLDQTILSIHKPVLTDDPDEIEDTVLVPGLVKKVNNKDSYRILSELQGPDSSHFNMLQLAQNFGKEHSGFQGGGSATTSKGGKVTARQALLQEEQKRQALSLNTKQIEFFECDCAKLRVANILQFYTIPEKNKDITGEDDAMKNFMRVIRIDDTELTDGSYGTSVVKIANNDKNLPTPEQIDVEETMGEIQGQNVEVKVVTPDYIRNVEFDVSIEAESSYMQKHSLEQAMGTEFYQLMLANPLANQMENIREVVKLYDKDPDKFIQQQGQGMPQGMPGQQLQPAMAGGVPPSRQILGGKPGLESMV